MMENLIYIGKVLGAITVIGGFIASIFITIRKVIHVVDEVEKLVNNQQDIQTVKNDLETQKEEDKKSHDLLLSIARRQLLESFNKVFAEREMSQETFMVLSQLYNSYIDNGGNSVICDMWEEIKKIKITVKEDEKLI